MSDNVAYIDLDLPSRSGEFTQCRVINAYGPTSPAAEKNPQLLDDFYDELSSAVNVPSNNELFICGDFNSRLGKLDDDDALIGLSNYMGKYGIGKRNNNGSRLLEFVIANNLFVCNNAFPHKSRHITTRVGYIKDWANPLLSGMTKPFYSMIDYVLCKRRFKSTLTNARSYFGTLTDSDHKLVCARFMFQNRHLTFAKRCKSDPKYECSSLTSRIDLQTVFSKQVSENVSDEMSSLSDPQIDCNTKVEKLVTSLKSAAAKVIGLRCTDKPPDHCNDEEVRQMSEHRRKLRLQLNNNSSSDRSSIRAEINKLKNQITKRLKHLKELRAEQLAESINNTDESRRMFEAVRELKNNTNSTKQQTISVHDEDNNLISNDSAKASALKTWFQNQFTGNNTEPALDPFVGPPRSLDNPITPSEVESAAKALKNNRATGPDGVQNELLKYGGVGFYTAYSKIINNCFETNTHLKAVGEAVIAPLQKPKKPKGPLKNIRPLTLSNSARKMLSLLTLRRIQTQVDSYTGPWQSAYKQGRSCSDLVWCQRMLTAVVMEKRWSFHKMGIDMSAAFDTIQRSTILNLLTDAGCSEDEVRLVRFLLSNTVLKIRVNSSFSVEFTTTLGSFQGDSLSGCLFTLVLAGALHHLRTLITYRNIIPYNPDTLMPLESEYADDVDFMDEELIRLQFILPVANMVLKEWSLNINCSKTEFVEFYLAEKGDMDSKNKHIRDNESWRKTKLLGSFMCSSYDIERRCISGNIAFNDYKNVWLQGKQISTCKLIQVYEAMVVSVIMYNCSSWAVPNEMLRKLDVCHRTHLRQILKIKWPTTITNEKLYKLSSTTPLSDRVKSSRWRLLGHILRSPEDTPAALALSYAVAGSSHLKGRLGRHKINLLSLIRKDINRIPVDIFSKNELLHQKLKLKDQQDIDVLRRLAHDRSMWKRLFYYVV